MLRSLATRASSALAGAARVGAWQAAAAGGAVAAATLHIYLLSGIFVTVLTLQTSSHDWDACGFGAAQLRQLPQSPPLPSLAGPRTLHSCYPTASHDSKQSMNSTLPQPQQHTEEMQEQHAAQSSFGGSSASLAAAAAKPFSRDGRQTITGYPESHLYVAVSDTPAAAAGGSGGQPTAPPLLPLVPPEVLRIALRQEVQQEIEHKTLNAYSLSRCVSMPWR